MVRKRKSEEKEPELPEIALEKIEKPKQNIKNHSVWMFATIILIIILGIVLLTPANVQTSNALSPETVKTKVVNYINNNLVPGGGVTALNVTEKSGMYEITTEYKGQQYPLYASKDGMFLFASAPIDMSKTRETAKPDTKKTCSDMEKKDNTELEAFVVSYCPFGLQMQRVIVNMPEELRKNVKIRYIGDVSGNTITSMHGEKEAQENLRQICIREEQPSKYYPYLTCFIKEGKTEECLAEANINKTALSECTNSTGIDYAKKDFELQNKYSVSGSPTLVLNGEHVSEFDFGGRNVEALKQIICCSSKTPASICNKTLSTTEAARSFSKTYDEAGTGTTAASCG